MPETTDGGAKPLSVVMLRRGNKVWEGISTRILVSAIREKKLRAGDEISGDGRHWIRLDRHRQLRQFFAECPDDESTNPAPPPGLHDRLSELASLLKEINR